MPQITARKVGDEHWQFFWPEIMSQDHALGFQIRRVVDPFLTQQDPRVVRNDRDCRPLLPCQEFNELRSS